MQGINLVVIGGNLGSDPELRYLSNGDPVCTLSLGVNKKWTDKGGAKKESTLWVRVNVWGKSAENCAQYLTKGSPVLIQGELKENKWEDKETGKPRSTLEVTARNVTFLGSGNGSGSGSGGSKRQDPGPTGGGYDDDIPF